MSSRLLVVSAGRVALEEPAVGMDAVRLEAAFLQAVRAQRGGEIQRRRDRHRGMGEMAVVAASLRRDFRIDLSYRASFVLGLLSTVFA
jgi:hypothetical protein